MLYSRRNFAQLSAAGSLGLIISPSPYSLEQGIRKRTIPVSGEPLPIVGLGTWLTFDVGNSSEALKIRQQVLMEMHKLGGKVIDSSPMYGTSEATVGKAAAAMEGRDSLFYATKVWTSGKQAGMEQMDRSMKRMRRSTMDLMQIHNLVDWETHVKTLRAWKDAGKIRYWGLTHYVDSAHGTLEKIIRQEKPDFAQFNYSILSRHAEKSLLNTCRENNTAVIINQPYDSGSLFRKVKGQSLPEWSKDFDINSWGQYFLKFILSHEAVTCAIPGTSKPHHVIDNMQAGYGVLPDTSGREKMVAYLKTL